MYRISIFSPIYVEDNSDCPLERGDFVVSAITSVRLQFRGQFRLRIRTKALPCTLAKTEFPTMPPKQKRMILGNIPLAGTSPHQAHITLKQAGAVLPITLAQTAKQ